MLTIGKIFLNPLSVITNRISHINSVLKKCLGDLIQNQNCKPFFIIRDISLGARPKSNANVVVRDHLENDQPGVKILESSGRKQTEQSWMSIQDIGAFISNGRAVMQGRISLKITILLR